MQTFVSQGALDERWYNRFLSIASFQDYDYLSIDKKKELRQKAYFFSGKINNPKFEYPELKRNNLFSKKEKLIALKKDILREESNVAVRKAYLWKIDEKIVELKMLKAAKDKNDKKFLAYSKMIYGKPEIKIFHCTIDQVKRVISREIRGDNILKQEVAKRLRRELFSFHKRGEKTCNKQYYQGTGENKKDDDVRYGAKKIKSAFEKFILLKNIKGWVVKIDYSGGQYLFNVNQEKKIVSIPKKAKLTKNGLAAIIAHELGVHVLRREKGIHSRLLLLGMGLDHYIKGEEGLATYQEQVILKTSAFSGLNGYLSIGLVLGIGGKKRSFREVFDILRDWYFLTSKSTDTKKAKKNADNSAWERCLRTFRGTTGETIGNCFTRDIIYREGNIGIWNLVKNKSKEVRRFSVGKYDPTNPRHTWILDQLGITGIQSRCS